MRLHHLRQKMWSSLERLSQPFHVHFSSSGMHLHVHFDGGSCQLQFSVWIRGRWFAGVSFERRVVCWRFALISRKFPLSLLSVA